MTQHPWSLPGVVDVLRHEFGRELPEDSLLEVVQRLSANGAVSLPVLEHLARIELTALTATGCGEDPTQDLEGSEVGPARVPG